MNLVKKKTQGVFTVLFLWVTLYIQSDSRTNINLWIELFSSIINLDKIVHNTIFFHLGVMESGNLVKLVHWYSTRCTYIFLYTMNCCVGRLLYPGLRSRVGRRRSGLTKVNQIGLTSPENLRFHLNQVILNLVRGFWVFKLFIFDNFY